MTGLPRWFFLWVVVFMTSAPPLSPAQEILNARVEPTPFSPDGGPPADRDTTWISYEINAPADSVRLDIFGVGIERFFLAGYTPAHSARYRDPWDGRDPRGSVVADGLYRIRITLFQAGRAIDHADVGVTVDTVAPRVETSAPFPLATISPDNDGFADTFAMGFRVLRASPEDLTRGEIRDRWGNLVAPLRLPGGDTQFEGAGYGQFQWSGETALPPLREGFYVWEVSSVDLADNRSELTGAFEVDLLPPIVSFEPNSPRGLRFSNPDTIFFLRGTATDTLAGVSDIEISGDGGRTWNDVFDGNRPRVNWSDSLHFVPLSGEGIYEFRVRATDGHTHRNEPNGSRPQDRIRLTFDTTSPEHIETLAAQPRWRDGDEIELITRWSEDSLDIAANFSRLDPTYTDGAETVERLEFGEYRVRYSLPESSGVPEHLDAPIIITARDGATAPVAIEAVRLGLDNTPPAFLQVELLSEHVVANGDTLTLSILSDASSYELSADFSALDSGFAPGEESAEDLGDGHYEVHYRISDSNARPDQPNITIPLRLGDSARNEAFDFSAEVSLVNGSNASLVTATVRPSVVNTHLDSVTVDYSLLESPDTPLRVEISVLDSLGLVETLVDRTLYAGDHSVSWDGRDTSGVYVPDGNYRIDVTVQTEDRVGRLTLGLRLDSISPQLGELFVVPTSGPVTPDADLLRDSLSVTIEVRAGDDAPNRTTAHITGPSGEYRARMYTIDGDTIFTGSGVPSFRWGGEGAVEDGPHHFRVRSFDNALDRIGHPVNGDSISGRFDLDLNGPVITFDMEDSTRYATLPLHITGWAHDIAGVQRVSYSLDQGRSWNPADYGPRPQSSFSDSLRWSLDLGDDNEIRSTYELWVRGEDSFGHISGVNGVVPEGKLRLLFDADAPFFLSVESPRLSYSNGDSVWVSVELDDPNASVVADFSLLDDLFNETRVVLVHDPGTPLFEFRYPISTDNGRPPGFYPVLFSASDGLNTARIDSSLVLQLETFGRRILSIPARFDPADVIELKLDHNARVEVQIYNLASDLVWEFRDQAPPGILRVPWDRRNRFKQLVHSGPYLVRVRIEATGGGSIREWVRPTVVVHP